MKNMWILADAAETGGNEAEVITMEETSTQGERASTQQNGSNTELPTDPTPAKPQGPNMMLWFMLPLLLIYMFFMFRGPKKKQQEHQKMVSSLSKNDRVRTIGGIFGTVLDIRDEEIVLKIDESTNAKMRVSPQAIATVLTEKSD
jgi:preprotein translocase subunit YajC